MGYMAAWVGAPTWKPGLDNVGTQQPCIFIYSALLPGITNVTDRAWHFGFYPWFIRAFERRHPEASDAEFREALRRADCLATLVAARHAIVQGEDGQDDRQHGAAFPGRRKLVPAARLLSGGRTIRLSDYTESSDTNRFRYFKNGLGGLGQYYLGVLRDEYRALAGDWRTGVRYTTEIGLPLAEAFGDGLDEDAFMAVIESGAVTAGLLDSLAGYCPCALHEHREIARQYLVDMILARVPPWITTTQTRRLTLGLALDFLARADGAEEDDEAIAFLAACYGRALRSAHSWHLPDRLAEIRGHWGLYLRNEMLSLAWEAIFKVALEAVDGQRGISNIRQAAAWCVQQPEFVEALAIFGHPSFDEAVTKERRTLPPLAAYQDPQHELALWRGLTDNDGSELIASAMRMFVVLVARHGVPFECYAPFHLPARALVDYPLTLDTLGKSAAGPWREVGAREWLATLIGSALSAHQRVAIRKLGQSGDDTLMFRIGDDGLFVERHLDEVVETQPRLTQAFQILRDLGLTAPFGPGRLPRPTGQGLAALDEIRNG
jgi:hypothetical protein